MKKILCLLSLFLLAGTGVKADTIRSDDQVSQPNWKLLEDKRQQTGFTQDQGVEKVLGIILSEVKVKEIDNLVFRATTSFFMPSGQPNWASAALLLLDNKNSKIAFTTIFEKPGTCLVSVDGRVRVPVNTTPNKWYQMKVEVADFTAKMKIWPQGEAEPPAWQVESVVSLSAERVDAVGLCGGRTEVSFKDFSAEFLSAQDKTTLMGDDKLKATISSQGFLKKLEVNRAGNWEAVDFRKGRFRGYLWTVGEPGMELRPVRLTPDDPAQGTPGRFSGLDKEIEYSMAYKVEEGRLVMTAGLKNKGAKEFKPSNCGVQLGINLEMAQYPEWNNRYSPTLLRCEKDFFWGYFMTPKQRILAICSPDPVASYTTHYSNGGHRIYTSTLDFLHEGPLPPRHPQGLDVLPAGAEKKWKIILEDVKSLEEVKTVIARETQAPLVDCDTYTVDANQSFEVRGISTTPPSVSITSPDGKRETLALKPGQPGSYKATYQPTGGIGLYSVQATNGSGKGSEATLSVRRPWAWYMTQARKEAVAKVQIGCSHIEGWYGLFPSYTTRRVLPDKAVDDAIDQTFAEIWPLMYDMTAMRPTRDGSRIQNHSGAAELMAERYRATGDIKDLEFASSLADCILKGQTPDGVYRSGRTHYTSVIYVAKNILTVALAEAEAAAKDPKWAAKAKTHFDSVRRAVDELAKDLDNIQTEGEMTYEDGMIGCSYTQLAMFALQQTDPEAVKKYLDAALYLKDGHKCLSQLLIPDSRMNGGSLRYWESQYDVMMTPNMMNSPHGWSAWRVYGLWYLYLLTGEESYMNQVESALGSCAQLIDSKTGELRWGFVPDPYVRAWVFEEDPAVPGKPTRKGKVIGEQYIPMISQWYKPAQNTWVFAYGGKGGGSCNNDVHEIFKCIGEVMFENAYVLERADGSLVGWNCKATRDPKGAIQVSPSDACVSRVHLNLKKGAAVEIAFAGGKFQSVAKAGMGWVGPGGAPFQIRKISETLSKVSQ